MHLQGRQTDEHHGNSAKIRLTKALRARKRMKLRKSDQNLLINWNHSSTAWIHDFYWQFIWRANYCY